MKQEDASVMSSAMRRLGHEISKLGLRMRNRSPSGSENDVFGSTDEVAFTDQQGNTLLKDASCENCSASGPFDTATRQIKQRRHSRNELDEDVECRERKSSIKAALKPVLSRKSRSDLARYARPNVDLNVMHASLKRNGSENSIKENDIDGVVTANNGRGKKKDEVSAMAYRFAMKGEATEGADTTKGGRKGRRMKRSKSFSGLLGWRHGAKQDRKNSAENDTKWAEFPRKVLRRTRSLTKVDSMSSAKNSITVTLPKQPSMIPDMRGTQRNISSNFSPEISLTSSSNGESRTSNKQSEVRFSYMALKGFRYEEGMIETDLCSTEL